MKNIIFLFPGQGSQSVGMGHDLHQEFDIAREIFDMADELAQLNITRLCFKGPLDELTKTINLQPAVTAVNLACLAILEKEGIKAGISAGHSLGEYAALCAAKVLSKPDTLRAVFKRGWLMDREANQYKGAMAAIIGITIEDVEKCVLDAGETGPGKLGTVAVANYNAEKQIVISGTPEAVKQAGQFAAEKGGRAILLKVSGAWHSDLIKGAFEEFESFLQEIKFNPPQGRVYQNVTANYTEDPSEIKDLMAKQLCSPVRWYETIQTILAEKKPQIFVEVGPGRVLAGLLKKILPKKHPAQVFNINNLKTLENFLNAMA